jgi:hypothetical protein
MISNSVPAFSSPELQAAFEKSRETLEGADEARNRVSQDIKALEAYLVGLNLTVPFRFGLGKMLIPDDEQGVAASLEYGGCASGKIQEDAILFDKDTHGRTRLLYEVCRWEGQVEVDAPGGPFFWDESTLEREIKPLIETKFEVRKAAYGKLPDFVTALAKHYAIDPWKMVDSEELPF